MDIIPKPGFKGLVENWQSDLIAAISVSMVAMPLALGIALASGVPPITGILSAIIGGIVTTFFNGSNIAINGPAAGLIAVVLGSIAILDDGSDQTLNYVFAAITVSGAIQIILGLFKLGRFADIFHASVIHGILAAIGIIIFAKQIHIVLGTETTSETIIGTIIDAFRQIPNINPFVAIISLMGLLLLVFHSRISYKFFHFLPAPVWVLVLAIPFAYFFNFFDAHSLSLFGRDYQVGPSLLINIPDNLLDAISYPNFSKINTLEFWSAVVSITMIASVESLAIAKAIDKLDPYKRKTNFNKDLIGIGVSTMVSGALGGLPIINVIVRTTVNVHNHAKTKWANLYHGVLLLLFIFLLAPVIQQVPLAALAVLLVFTGFKLASPKVFKHVYDLGIEQLIFVIGTLVITLLTDLLIGIFGGLLLALITHLLLAKVSIPTFFKMIYRSGSELIVNENKSYSLRVKGIANFMGILKIDKLINQVPVGSILKVDLSGARLVDYTVLEHLYDFQRTHTNKGGSVEIGGLENHISSTKHKLGLKLLTTSAHKLTAREIKLKEIADAFGWTYQSESSDPTDYFETFDFFKTRPIEAKYNCISAEDEDIHWEITDVIFEEGAFFAAEEYKTTLCFIKLPFNIPVFTLEERGFLDKYLHLSEHKDIDYVLYHDFSNEFVVKVDDVKEMGNFLLNKDLKAFLEKSDFHHLESNGEAILIFEDDLRLAQIQEYTKIIKFAEELRSLLKRAQQ